MPDVKLTLPGTHRAVSFEDTIARASDVAARMGITRVADVTGLDHIGIPVVMAVRPAARSLSVFQGKGYTRDAARASALMEAIEFHHAEHVRRPLRLASLRELARDEPIDHVPGLPLATDSRFHADLRVPWLEARVLGTDHRRSVPLELVDVDTVSPAPYLDGCFTRSSAGLASGNTTDEATVHALCELIEHDSEVLWILGGPARRLETRLCLDSVDDPGCRWLLDRIRDAGVLVGVWDLTSDVGVATYAAILVDADPRGPRRQPPAAGFGCHLDPAVALSRAITEAVQSRTTFIAGSRDDLTRRDNHRLRDPAHLSAMAELLAEDHTPVRYGEVPDRSGATFGEDLEVLIDRLLAVGTGPPLVVDLTEPDIGIPVVTALVPGLECQRSEAAHARVQHGPRARAMSAAGGR